MIRKGGAAKVASGQIIRRNDLGAIVEAEVAAQAAGSGERGAPEEEVGWKTRRSRLRNRLPNL
eukprot:5759578-Pyramimonas_sp.AAC.1